MRSLFKDLQKSHMKQLKAERKRPEGEGVAGHQRLKGFVKDSLVKVELEEKWEESCREKLKACVVCTYVGFRMMISSVHPYYLNGHYRFFNMQ